MKWKPTRLSSLNGLSLYSDHQHIHPSIHPSIHTSLPSCSSVISIQWFVTSPRKEFSSLATCAMSVSNSFSSIIVSSDATAVTTATFVTTATAKQGLHSVYRWQNMLHLYQSGLAHPRSIAKPLDYGVQLTNCHLLRLLPCQFSRKPTAVPSQVVLLIGPHNHGFMLSYHR